MTILYFHYDQEQAIIVVVEKDFYDKHQHLQDDATELFQNTLEQAAPTIQFDEVEESSFEVSDDGTLVASLLAAGHVQKQLF